MMKHFFGFLLMANIYFVYGQSSQYAWLQNYDPAQSINYRVEVPTGFERIAVSENSFADWLRHLPLKARGAKVYLYDGSLKYKQDVQFAVIDIDTGDKDLQQCADAVMRLKAEYHYACGEYKQIHFNFTSGDRIDFSRWQTGYRPRVSGNKVNWVKSRAANGSYDSFRLYMNSIYMFAGTYSLSRELKPISKPHDLQAGDVFIYGGFPGHAVIVVDVARHQETGKKVFLLAQSYMPAQDMHLLKNPTNQALSPWYEIPEDYLETPEWGFEAGSLMRF